MVDNIPNLTYFGLKQHHLHFRQIQTIMIITMTMNKRIRTHIVEIPSTVSVHQMINVGITSIGLNFVKSDPSRPSLGFPEREIDVYHGVLVTLICGVIWIPEYVQLPYMSFRSLPSMSYLHTNFFSVLRAENLNVVLPSNA